MRELLDFFSLSTNGDVPIGLTTIRNTTKINQPVIEETKQMIFTPLFKQNFAFCTENININDGPDVDCGIQWLNYIDQKK